MEDKQLRILVLTKLYEFGRTHYTVREFEKNVVFQGIDTNQLNFAFQYLGTQNLIQYSSKEFIAEMPTGQSDKLTTREKAKLSALLAATCLDDPSCMVHWMWQSNKPYTALLRNAVFTPLVDFFSRL